MARTVAARKRVVRRDWTRADVKELRQHSKNKRPSKPSLEYSSVARVPSDKRPACSESRSDTAASKQGGRERSRVLRLECHMVGRLDAQHVSRPGKKLT